MKSTVKRGTVLRGLVVAVLAIASMNVPEAAADEFPSTGDCGGNRISWRVEWHCCSAQTCGSIWHPFSNHRDVETLLEVFETPDGGTCTLPSHGQVGGCC